MTDEGEDRDYLARPKPPTDVGSFVAAVKEAYVLEHRCTKDYQIAEVAGISAGRLSQIFKSPDVIQPETIRNLIEPIASKTHRKNIRDAWVRQCFPEDSERAGAEMLVHGEVTEKTLRRIDRLVRQSRLDRALKVIRDALELTQDYETRQQLLDRSYFLQQRLDRFGEAMLTARTIYEEGKAAASARRMAMGLMLKERILRSLPDTDTAVLEAIRSQVLKLIEHEPMPDLRVQTFTIATKSMVESEARVSLIQIYETSGGKETELRELLSELQVTKTGKESRKEKTMRLELRVRLHLALGEVFKAEELLEKEYESGFPLQLHTNERVGILNARVLAARGKLGQAADYYARVAALCRQEQSLYYHRLAQQDMAKTESDRF